MTMWDKLKEMNRKGLKDELFGPEYQIRVWVFRTALALTFILLVAAVVVDGTAWKSMSFHCPEDGPSCMNPYHPENHPILMQSTVRENCPDPDLCAIPSFMPGETWGAVPSILTRLFGYIVGLIWLAAFIYNHVVYNLEGKK